MTTVTLSVASRKNVTERALSALSGKNQGAHITFASVELLWQTLTRKRWEILQAITGKEAMSMRNVARLVKRDIKAVHGDIHALLDAGILNRTDKGMIEFPYDKVHVDFMLKAA